MSNPSKQKGTRWESARAEWWQGRGKDARRVALHGSGDQGDVHVMDTARGPVLEECKNAKRLAIPEWLRQADVERDNAGAWLCAVAYKLPGVGATDPGRHPWVLRSCEADKLLSYVAELEGRVQRLEFENAQLRERRYYA